MSSFRDADALRQMFLSRKGSEPAEAISLLDARKRQVAAVWPDEMSAEAQVLP